MSSSSSKRSPKSSLLTKFSKTIAHGVKVLERRERSASDQKRLNAQVFRRVLSLFLFFAIWQLLCLNRFNFFINFENVPSPGEVLAATVQSVTNNPMKHIQASAVRVLSGFMIAAVLGISLGILIGWFKQVEDLIFLPLELLRPIQPLLGYHLPFSCFPTPNRE